MFQLASERFRLKYWRIMRVEDLKLDELLEFATAPSTFRAAAWSCTAPTLRPVPQGSFRDGRLVQARRILTRFGYFWGQADAAAMRRVFKWDSVVDLVKAGARLHALQGVAPG